MTNWKYIKKKSTSGGQSVPVISIYLTNNRTKLIKMY